MLINLNFEGVRKECPESGDHVFVISSAQIAPSKKGDTNNLNLQLQEEQTGFPVYKTINLGPKALWAAQLFFDAVMGDKVEGELDLETDDEGNVPQLVGEKVGATATKDKSDKGRDYLNIDNGWFSLNSNWDHADDPV
jgi:hypothetical protein